MVRVLVILLAAVLAGWALADVLQTPANQLRSLPKPAWLVLSLVPFLGAMTWFGLGRVEPGDRNVAAQRPIGPDDDPEFLRRLGRRKPDGPD
jgi:hypothetical protein